MSKSVKTIAIVGAGQIGSRHLQALAKLDIPVRLQIIDSSEDALKITEKRYLKIPKNEKINSIEFHHKLEELNAEIDLCVIATNSDVRFQVFQELTTKKRVSNIIFEKVVFQSYRHFQKAEEMLLNKNISCWVNCPRRMFPIYNKLKKIMAGDNKVNLKISGGDWGLACNAIHFIDLLAFLSQDASYKILGIIGLDPIIWKSKRKGFIEITGKLAGIFSNGSRIRLESIAGSKEHLRISINNSKVKAIFDETSGIAKIARQEKNWNETIFAFKTPFQSELTHIAAKEILNSGDCQLTGFNESTLLHQPFLKAIKNHIENIEHKQYNYCPIT